MSIYGTEKRGMRTGHWRSGLGSSAWALVLAGGLAMSCTELAPAGTTCNSDDECLELYAALNPASNTPGQPGPWTCIGDDPLEVPEMGPVDADGVQAVALIITAVDFVNGNPIPELELKGCNRLDESCDQPVMFPTMSIEPTGRAFQMQMPFRSGLEFNIRMEATNYFTSELFLTNELTLAFNGFLEPPEAPAVSTVFSSPLPLATEATMDSFFRQLQLERIPGTGVTAFRMFDCMGARAAGTWVTLTPGDRASSPDIVDYSFLDGLPANPPSPGEPARTDDQATAGFGNLVAPGTLTVTAYAPVGPNGTPYATTTVRTTADALTIADLHPPRPYTRQGPAR